ncbi:hypothetical protein CHLRE_13g605600v5 [Chlamydomonas reinhardtii]|uniref:2'-5'-oligoadenylate synthetase 1 domain-containing protein n=1 Tax=Chlamydomonas reinhardtii TaxID=3055 RepID=A0A2K3D1E8_CHLRE|nr:uncharacterized protein CHLRE_13g605600v5 [Chlamydomonas reinhardtii]PNW74368.1 hypothetical protein CHLRE_13g605600v5 [Chlamydomonas reinhardtii]
MLKTYTREELEKMFYDDEPGTNKSYIKYFNGKILPLANAGTSPAVAPCAAAATIHELLGQCPLITFDRFHNGGSLGRRTLVRKDFDVDLSVFVTEFTGRVLDYWAGDWSGEAGERLQVDMMKDVAAWLCDQNFKAVEVEHGTHYKHCINVKVTVRTGMFTEADVDVDVKMAANVVRGNGRAQRDALMKQLWDTPPHLRQADPAREAALAEALTAVVKEIPDWDKSVVRLLKCWYKLSGLKDRIPFVPSVLLEVLALAAAQRLQKLPTHSRRFRDAEAFLAALELLDAAVTRREVVVLEAGPVWGYTRAQAESCRHVWRNDPVVVLHPIDPTCNLAAGCTVEWAALADEARTLHEVVLTRSMWDLLTDSSLAPALKALEIEMKLQRERAQHERAVAMRK